MNRTKKYHLPFVALSVVLMFFILVNLGSGSVSIPIEEILSALTAKKTSRESWSYIIWNYRVPKAITAVLVGASLSLSGLLMQTLFRNPLAGPFVLGISSGASLGAAILIMGTSLGTGWLTYGIGNDLSLAIASSLGSFLVLLIVVMVASRVKDSMALLIIGLMFGSITAAVVTVLSYFTPAEQLQQYIFWSFGTVGNLSWTQLSLLGSTTVIGLLLSVLSLKSLNALLLGEQYADSLGVPLKTARYVIIISTGILAGGVTAFAGPIAFIGLAVPHLTRQIFNTTEHRILVPAVMLYGSILLLFCDTLAQLPGMSYVLPINAITSIIGAPVVIWLLIRKKKMVF